MALIKCSKCGKQISDKAPSCPHCGEVFAPQSSQPNINGTVVQPYQQPTTGNIQMQASAKPMSNGKIAAVIITVLVVILSISAAIIVPLIGKFQTNPVVNVPTNQNQGNTQQNQTPSSNQGNSSSEKTYTVKIDVSCIKNDWFSKYNVDVIVDSKTIATLPHGTSDTYTLPLKEGSYKVQFKKNGDDVKSNVFTLRVEGDTSASYELQCKHNKIEVKEMS